MQVAFFPDHYRGGNPYLDLLETSLREIGINVYPTKVDRPFYWWLKQHQREINVLHFHWLHHIYHQNTYRESVTRLLKFGMQLSYAKLLGYRIVWTLHNLYPHERPRPHLDQWMRWLILRFADAVIVHCHAAKSTFYQTFHYKHPVYVAPHGHYIGIYPDTITQVEARERLGICRKHLSFLYLGQIRPYKGLRNLLRSFNEIPHPNLNLIIAGTVPNDDTSATNELRQMLEKDTRCISHLNWIPNEELQVYFKAADVVVCPFDRVLTSGSAVLAMSFGRPVVVPALGCLPELITPDIGILYNPNIQGSLKDALLRCTTMDLDIMGQNAYQAAKLYSWRNTAEIVRAAYNGD